MKIDGMMTLKGVYEIVHRDKTGKEIDRITLDNTITNTGKAALALLAQGNATTKWTRLAIGTGTTAATAANTTLETELTSPSLARALGTATRVTVTVTNDTSQLVHTFSSTATAAVTEVGVLDSASGGTLISRKTFAAKNLTSGDTLQVTHKLTVA